MDWKVYTERLVNETFEQIVSQLQDFTLRLDARSQSEYGRHLKETLDLYKVNKDPRGLFRPAAIKLANTADFMASTFQRKREYMEASILSNLAFEIFRSFHNEKYTKSMTISIKTYAITASSPATITFDQSATEIRRILGNVDLRNIHSAVEYSAYEGLLQAYDEFLQKLILEDKKEEIREFLTTNFQKVIDIAQLLGTQILLIQKWTEYVQTYTIELLEAIRDSSPEQYAGLDSNAISILHQSVQQLAYQKTFDTLKIYQTQIVNSLRTKISFTKELIDPPPIKDRDGEVESLCRSALQQRSKNISVAIQLLQQAQRINSSNWRISEWLGTLYMRSMPSPNYLKAKEAFELIPPNWMSNARDWNLSILYCKLSDESYKQKAFEIMAGSFENEPRIKKLYFCLDLAIDLNSYDYLLKYLEFIPLFEAAAYGYILSQEHKRNDLRDKFLILLEGYLSEEVINLPDHDVVLTSLQVEKLKNVFIHRKLLNAGILYFEDRYGKLHKIPQGAMLLDPLLELLELNEDFERVVEIRRKNFEFNIHNGNIPQGKQISEAQELLRYCKEHKLPVVGLSILNKLSHFNVLLTDDSQEYWKNEFEMLKSEQDNTKQNNFPSAVVSSQEIQKPIQHQQESEQNKKDQLDHKKQSQAAETLASINPEISRYSTWGEVIENREKIEKSLSAVHQLIGDESEPLTLHWVSMLDKLQEFRAQSDINNRRVIVRQLSQLQSLTEGKILAIKTPQINSYIAAIRASIAKAVANAASSVNTLPKIDLKVLNTYLTNQADIQTTLVVELENNTEIAVQRVKANLQLGKRLFILDQEDSNVILNDGIPEKSTRVISFRIRRDPNTNGDREIFNFSGCYDTEGMQDIPLFDDVRSEEIFIRAKTKANTNNDPIKNPYISTGSVPADRVENFHGRDDLLKRVQGAVADQEAREALFINGIRRVGKTSLLNKLEAMPPSGVYPVSIRLDLMNPSSTGGFFHSLASFIQSNIAKRFKMDSDFMELSSPTTLQSFLERPQHAFPEFLEKIKPYLVGGDKLLLMFDEFQIVTEAIKRSRAEGTSSKLDIVLLDMLRGYIESRTFLAMFTGSSLFSEIQDHLPGYNRLWGSLTPLDIGFVDADAVGQILRIPAKRYQINFTNAAVQRTFEYTQGYPWFVQMIGTEVVAILNSEDRLVVTPDDIDVSAGEIIGRDYNFDGYWWDKSRFDPKLDGAILRAILDRQPSEWYGVPVPTIVEFGKKLGLQQEAITQRLPKLRLAHIIERTPSGIYRIKALILEKWLKFKRMESNGDLPFLYDQKIKSSQTAIIIDHENVWFGLSTLKDKASDMSSFISQTSIEQLVSTWNDYSQKYGKIVARYAVAEWHGQSDISRQRHQQVYRTAGFETPLPIMHQQQAADNELKQRVTDLQINHPEISTYILVLGDGDYANMVEGLMNSGKDVIIWSLRNSLHGIYDKLHELRGLKIEYIEDILSLSEF